MDSEDFRAKNCITDVGAARALATNAIKSCLEEADPISENAVNDLI